MKAVIYARYSSENQTEQSIEGQIRECTEFANINNIDIVGTYIDRAQSAEPTTDTISRGCSGTATKRYLMQ